MASLHLPRPSPRTAAVAEVVRQLFWVVALGVIVCYGFFVALGAFSPGDAVGLTIAVVALLALWLLHAWAQRHRNAGRRDPRLTAARERRGF